MRQELNEAEVIPIPSSLQAIGDQNMPSQSPAPPSSLSVTAEREGSPQISDRAADLNSHLPSQEVTKTFAVWCVVVWCGMVWCSVVWFAENPVIEYYYW